MAYSDYDFYVTSYHGSTVPESDFLRASERASYFLDILTSDRLVNGLPSNERAQIRIKKAVCELAEVYYQIGLAEKQALSAAEKKDGASGVVTSMSSGSESVSYATPQQIGAGAKEWSSVFSVAGDPVATNKLLSRMAIAMLSGVRTDEGVPILYGGV